MVETRHLRLEYDEALESKKQLLSAELDLLHVLKRVKNYRTLRKKETAEISKYKGNINTVKSKIKGVLGTFPKEALPKKEKVPKKKKEKEVVEKVGKKPKRDKSKSGIQLELEEIQRKLDRLNELG